MTGPREAGVRQHLRAMLPTFPPAERRIADAILADPSLVVTKTITEVAQACRTSETTVVRFCRAAGFKGYPELRLAVATELGRDTARQPGDSAPGTTISRDDTLDKLVRKVAYADTQAIENTIDELDLDQLERAVTSIEGARRINLFGFGASMFAALDLQHKLLRIDRTALAITDPHLAMASAALLTPDDVAIGLSHSGETAEVVDFLARARERQAATIAITNYAKAPIATHADLVLTTAVLETRFRSGAMASRIAQLALVDCLYLAVAQRSYDDSMAALATTYDAVHPRPGTATSTD
jgi:DNA-binding MurR/RpiR family transcriptional regulator